VTSVNKTRLLFLVISAALAAVFFAQLCFFVSPGGMNDGGFW